MRKGERKQEYKESNWGQMKMGFNFSWKKCGNINTNNWYETITSWGMYRRKGKLYWKLWEEFV